jgi:hypothetical protein
MATQYQEDMLSELLDFIEENNISDVNQISWLTDEDCYIESAKSTEFKELLKRAKEALEE